MTEKTDVVATENDEASSKKKVIAIKKRNTQETWTSSRGNKYMFMFTNTHKVQAMLDTTIRPDGGQSDLLLTKLLMDNILEGNEYDFAYFDKKIANKDKSDEIILTDEDGEEIATYTFKWPGLLEYQRMLEVAKDANGNVMNSAMFELIMENVITPKTDWKYWDEHEGYNDVMLNAQAFLNRTLQNSEFSEVMGAATDFVNRKFR